MKRLSLFLLCAAQFALCDIPATKLPEELNKRIFRIFGEDPRTCSPTARKDISELYDKVHYNHFYLAWALMLLGGEYRDADLNNAIFDETPDHVESLARSYLAKVSPNQAANEQAIAKVSGDIRHIIGRNDYRINLPEGILGGYLGESLRRQLGNEAERAANSFSLERERQPYSYITPKPSAPPAPSPSYQAPSQPSQPKIYYSEECCSCLEKFNYQDIRPVILSCGHAVMCSNCVQGWYQASRSSKRNFSCPTCRKEMSYSELSYALESSDRQFPAASAPPF